MPRGGREAFSFAQNVSGGGSGNVSRNMNRAGTIERVEVRIYPGPETDLELNLYTVHEGTKSSIVQLEGKSVIDGDDDRYIWKPSHRFKTDAEIRVEYTNQDGANAYDFRVNMDVDYRDPMDRLAAALRGAF